MTVFLRLVMFICPFPTQLIRNPARARWIGCIIQRDDSESGRCGKRDAKKIGNELLSALHLPPSIPCKTTSGGEQENGRESACTSGVKEYARFPPVHHIQISRRKYNLYVSSALPVLYNAYK